MPVPAGNPGPTEEHPAVNILIVDDYATNRKLLGAQLEAEGHTTLEAADGVEALAVLEHAPVDAIIADILMPRGARERAAPPPALRLLHGHLHLAVR